MATFSPVVVADDRAPALTWAFEIKGGLFEPDLPMYKEFYGSDEDGYFGVAFTYQFREWLEVGGELGYMQDSGVGILQESNSPGGKVQYTLVPAHLFVTFRGRFGANPLLTPYVGGGITSAYYKQDIDSQSNRSGRTDLGFNARAGVRLDLTRFDRRAPKSGASSGLVNTYIFLEGQYFTTEVDDIDLGGIAYLLGFRFEFDYID
ncbi:MAG: outer membrane beta-barrel protein [Woeseiaceae bacterium]